jgi:transposase
MNYKYFVGIDVSKSWLDLTVMQGNQVICHDQIENDQKAIRAYLRSLFKVKRMGSSETFFCMEHTGIYNGHLTSILYEMQLDFSVESGLQIKQSSGIKRGKNDKVDSTRIAQYAFKNSAELKLWKPKRDVVIRLKELNTLRNRVVNVIKQLKTPLKESAGFLKKQEVKKIESLNKSSIAALERDLKKIDKEIERVIKSDEELNRLFSLVTSVTGIGSVTATEIIITTNEFKSIDCSKKYACYSGIAPFEHQSGSSVRGKTRVSSMGNKNIKKLLHMAALSAINCNGELKEFFQRKVQEGKNKMAVINAIRNKIIARIFACVKQNRIYQKNFVNPLFYP